jgi:hypothetical protein
MGKCPQFNTVFPEQEEVDRVGFEPTTSAMEIKLNIANVPIIDAFKVFNSLTIDCVL